MRSLDAEEKKGDLAEEEEKIEQKKKKKQVIENIRILNTETLPNLRYQQMAEMQKKHQKLTEHYQG